MTCSDLSVQFAGVTSCDRHRLQLGFPGLLREWVLHRNISTREELPRLKHTELSGNGRFSWHAKGSLWCRWSSINQRKKWNKKGAILENNTKYKKEDLGKVATGMRKVHSLFESDKAPGAVVQSTVDRPQDAADL